jgi:hypothetical protein
MSGVHDPTLGLRGRAWDGLALTGLASHGLGEEQSRVLPDTQALDPALRGGGAGKE